MTQQTPGSAEHEMVTPSQSGARPQRRIGSPPPPPDRYPDDEPIGPRQIAVVLRVLMGVGTAIALYLITKNTSDTLSDARGFDISAIQVIQVYAEGLFWMVFAVGLLIAGYVATKLGP